MLIREKMKAVHFSDSQNNAVKFIMDHPYALQEMNIREIASACFTSSATLMRISHKLGYAGWNEFKTAFLEEARYLEASFGTVDPNIPFKEKDSLQSIITRVADLKIQAIQETGELVRIPDLKEAARLVDISEQILVFGVNNLNILASEFALKMGRIRKKCRVSDLRGEIQYDGSLEDPKNCAIFLSYSGETVSIFPVLEHCRKNKIPVIAITSIGDSRLARNADVVLRICTREKTYSKIGWFTTEASFSYVLDLIYCAVFRKDYEKNLEYKISTSKRIERNRKVSADIMKEN